MEIDNWTIIEFECKSEVIKYITWGYTIQYNGKDLEMFGKSELSEPDFNNFISIDELNKEIIIGWLEKILNTKSMDEYLIFEYEKSNTPITIIKPNWQ